MSAHAIDQRKLYELALAQRDLIYAALRMARVVLASADRAGASRALTMIEETERTLRDAADLLPMPGATR